MNCKLKENDRQINIGVQKFYWLLLHNEVKWATFPPPLRFGSMYAGVTTTRHRALNTSKWATNSNPGHCSRKMELRFQRTVCSTKRIFFHTLYLMMPVRREPKSERPHILTANSYSCWATECLKVVVNITSHLNWDAWYTMSLNLEEARSKEVMCCGRFITCPLYGSTAHEWGKR